MKTRLIPAIVIAAAATLPVGAQINEATPEGCLQRATMMYADGNYIGCIDRLRHAANLPLTPAQQLTAAYYLALATQHTDIEAATRMFEQLRADYPGCDIIDHINYELGNCWYGRDYARALAYYEEVYDSALNDTEYEDLCYRMAYCCLHEGSYKDADGLFQTLRFSPRYIAVADFYRGYIAYRLGRYNDAIQLLKKADTSQAPGNMADCYLSQIYYTTGDYQKALATAKNALRIPDISTEYVAEAARIAGESAYHLGDDAQAGRYLAYYTGLVENPMPSALYILGLYAYNSGEYRLAADYLRRVTDCNDAMGQSANLYMGQIDLKSGDYDAALMAFERALSMDYDMDVKENAYYNYAVASVQGGRVPFGSAVNTFSNFLRIFPDSKYAPLVQEYIITSYLIDDNYQAALESINAMRQLSPATQAAKQRVLYVLGTKALASGDDSQALDYLTQASTITGNPEVSHQVALSLGEAYYRGGRYDDAINSFNKYLSGVSTRDKNYSLGWYDLGYARFAKGDYALAAKDFDKALAGDNLSQATAADTYNRLADCRLVAKDYDAALSAYDKAYSLSIPTGDYPLLQQAIIAGYKRDFTTKINKIGTLESDYPSSALIPDALLEKCEAYLQLGQRNNAIETYRRLVNTYPNTDQSRRGYLQMALTMLDNGQREEAKGVYRKVISQYPTSEEALVAIDQMKSLSVEDGTLEAFTVFVNSVDEAPHIQASEIDTITFADAEKSYITGGDTKRLKEYLQRFPSGASRPKALAYIMENEYDLGNDREAYRLACEFVEAYPDNSLSQNAYRIKALTEEADGRNVLALHSWTRLSRMASTPAMLTLARTGIMRTGRAAEADDDVKAAADALLQTAAEGTDEYIEAMYTQGWLLNRRGYPDAARVQWEAVASNLDNIYGVQSAYMIGQSYLDNGDADNAKIWAERVAKAPTTHKYWMARGFILLSDALKAQGETYKANQYLTSLKANYPGDDDDIQQMIEQRLNAN